MAPRNSECESCRVEAVGKGCQVTVSCGFRLRVIGRYQQTCQLDADGNRSQVTETDDQARTSVFYWGYDGMNRLASEVLDNYDDSQDYIARYSFDLSSNRMTKETDNAATSTAISAFLASGTFSGDETIGYEYDSNDRLVTEAKDADGTNDDTFTEYSYGPSDAFTMQTGKAVYEGLDDTGTLKEQTTYSYNLQGRMAEVEIDSEEGQRGRHADGVRLRPQRHPRRADGDGRRGQSHLQLPDRRQQPDG